MVKAIEWFINQFSDNPTPVKNNPAQNSTVLTPLRSTRTPKSATTHYRFTEIVPGGRAINQQIAVTVSYPADSIGIQFLRESKQFHKHTEQSASPFPFQRYWPSFSDMSPDQQRWYFYWRTQYRKGNALPTDLSYLFVYSYEILNLVEFNDAVQAAGQLWVLWNKYRKPNPKLDHYLPDWGGDLLAIQKNVETGLLWWEHVVPVVDKIPSEITNLLIDRYVRTERTKDIPLQIIMSLIDYRPANKYYQEHNQNGRLDSAYQQCIRIGEEYAFRTFGESQFTKFTNPKHFPIQKTAFASAPIGIQHPGFVHWGDTRQYLLADTLRAQLTGLVKYTENLLRKRDGYSRKLSGFSLPPELAALLDAEFAVAKVISTPVKVNIDQARAESLKAESDEISQMLNKLVVEEQIAPAKPLYTDLAEMRKLWRQLDKPSRLFIAAIFQKQNPTPPGVDRDAVDAMSILANQINDQAVKILGDRLLSEDGKPYALTEDFLDELEVVIGESPPDAQPTPITTGSDAVNPWTEYFDKLSPPEIALVQQIAKEGALSETDLDSILRPYGAMPNAVLDSLNEKAIDTTNHPLTYLDQGRWIAEEEDLREIRYHLFGKEK